ncbi:MAG: peroxide stress protein YaaA, partial [Moraxellaceae bacterium]|nr:peroxide stress protein YaaA [Moraxellaceae bacterium]
HLRILSGLYGLLRPLDRLQPYRLEMGTALANPAGRNLYAFWGDTIAQALNKALAEQGDDVLVNLASDEYSKAALTKVLAARVVTPQFREEKDGKFKIVSFYAKRARGLMAGYMVRNRVAVSEALKDFSAEGYAFNRKLSTPDTLVFTRRMPVK